MATKKTIKSAFESMMFVWGEPLDVKIAASAVNIDKALAKSYFEELKAEYDEQERGIRIREIDGAYQFITFDENYDYIRTIVTPVRERRLSQAALEVLAIVAYNQPITKSEIDSIRGVKSDRVLEGLANKGLVEELGRKDAVGRPIIFGTTQAFLTHLDLKSLKELPEIEDIEDILASDSLDELKEMQDRGQTVIDIFAEIPASAGMTKE
jgi:segregation and condensation protein B